MSQLPLVFQGQLNGGDLFLATRGKAGYGKLDLKIWEGVRIIIEVVNDFHAP